MSIKKLKSRSAQIMPSAIKKSEFESLLLPRKYFKNPIHIWSLNYSAFTASE
jgi:hypothetical protein